jgi:hypothetical protein
MSHLPPYEKLKESDEEVFDGNQPINQLTAGHGEVEPNNAATSCLPPPYDFNTSFPLASKSSQHQHGQQHHQQVGPSAGSSHTSDVEMLNPSGRSHPSVDRGSQLRYNVINVIQVTPVQRESYGSHVAASCFVFWCCGISGWIFGFTAFILALCASDKSNERGKEEEARKMGKASTVFSIIGALLGIILTIIYFCIVYNPDKLN